MKKILVPLLALVLLGGSAFYWKTNQDLHTVPQQPLFSYLVPDRAKLPSSYSFIKRQLTDYSTSFSYEDNTGTVKEAITFSESGKNTYEKELQKMTEFKSNVQDLRLLKNFTYKGSDGAIFGEFESVKSTAPYGLVLIYDHEGKLFKIYTTDTTRFNPDILISLLENTNVNK